MLPWCKSAIDLPTYHIIFRYEKHWETNKPIGVKEKMWYENDTDVILLSKKKLSAKQHYLSVARYVTGRASNLQAAENE